PPSALLASTPPPRTGPAGPESGRGSAGRALEWRQLDGGMLMQTADRFDAPGDDPATWQLKAGPEASSDVLADLALAWRGCRAAGALAGGRAGRRNPMRSCWPAAAPRSG